MATSSYPMNAYPSAPSQQPGYPPQGVYPAYPPGPQNPPGYFQGGATSQQPMPGLMPRPDAAPRSCPEGLEYLTQIDQLLVRQTVELFEAFTGWETSNRYEIKNSLGQKVYRAAEESGCLMRQCCGAHRGFLIHIVDNMNKEVLRIRREFKCFAGCCWFACVNCCAYEVVVETPSGEVMGYVRQSCSAWIPRFTVYDSEHEELFTMSGPWCVCECPCFDVEFNLINKHGERVGRVSKQWSGLVKELFADADNFGISFPMDLNVKAKATLIGAVFLIDFMYFEKKERQDNN